MSGVRIGKNVKFGWAPSSSTRPGPRRKAGGSRRSREKLEGTYTLDADCSGTMTFGFILKPGSQTHWDIYVTQDGKTGHMIRMDDGAMAVRSFEK